MTWAWQMRVSIIKNCNCSLLSTVSLFEVWRKGLKLPAGSSWGSIILINSNGSWVSSAQASSSGSSLLSGPMGRGKCGPWMKERGLPLISFSSWSLVTRQKRKNPMNRGCLTKSKVSEHSLPTLQTSVVIWSCGKGVVSIQCAHMVVNGRARGGNYHPAGGCR